MNTDRDVDKPMGNAELRLSLASIESEIASVSTKVDAVHTQAKKTNGRVNWQEKCVYISMGAMPLLTIWAGWLTIRMLNQPVAVNSEQLQSIVETALDSSLTK